jgi:predicted RNase H-like HicB family nuclease
MDTCARRMESAASFPCGSTTPPTIASSRAKTPIASALNLGHKASMQYRIRLIQSKEGWAVSCPSLPGCHSQGDTREEAVENIKSAIQEWLKVEAEESGVSKVKEDLVAI